MNSRTAFRIPDTKSLALPLRVLGPERDRQHTEGRKRRNQREKDEEAEGGERRSSFMFDIVHKLFRPLGVAAVGRLQNELACLRLGLEEHF